MYDSLLFLHFFGISIGAGTGIYMLAVSRHAARNLDPVQARSLMPGLANTVSGVGKLGLLLLLVSGISLVLYLGEHVWTVLFVTKLVLVALLITFLLVMNYLAQRVHRHGDVTAAKVMKSIAMLGPMLGILIILVAVLAFH